MSWALSAYPAANGGCSSGCLSYADSVFSVIYIRHSARAQRSHFKRLSLPPEQRVGKWAICSHPSVSPEQLNGWQQQTLKGEVTHHSRELMRKFFTLREKSTHGWSYFVLRFAFELGLAVACGWCICSAVDCYFLNRYRNHTYCSSSFPPYSTELLDNSSSHLNIWTSAPRHSSPYIDCISPSYSSSSSHFVLVALSVITFRFHLKTEKVQSYERRESFRKIQFQTNLRSSACSGVLWNFQNLSSNSLRRFFEFRFWKVVQTL